MEPSVGNYLQAARSKPSEIALTSIAISLKRLADAYVGAPSSRGETPKWAKSCPVAFAEYDAAVRKLVTQLRQSGFTEDGINRAIATLARAWIAGQSSVAEAGESK